METILKVEIQTGQGLMPAYCAVPATPPPWPGMVVIHDFTGMSHDLRAQADWSANEGFLAVAPDLYYWGSRLRCLRTIMRDIGQRRGGLSTTSRGAAAGSAITTGAREASESSGSAWAVATRWRWHRTGASRRRASTTADARPTPGHGCRELARLSGVSAVPTGHPSAGVPGSASTGYLPRSKSRTM